MNTDITYSKHSYLTLLTDSDIGNWLKIINCVSIPFGSTTF